MITLEQIKEAFNTRPHLVQIWQYQTIVFMDVYGEFDNQDITPEMLDSLLTDGVVIPHPHFPKGPIKRYIASMYANSQQ